MLPTHVQQKNELPRRPLCGALIKARISTLILRGRMSLIWPNQQKFASRAGAFLVISGVIAVGRCDLATQAFTPLGQFKLSAPPSMEFKIDIDNVSAFWLKPLTQPFTPHEVPPMEVAHGIMAVTLFCMFLFGMARLLLWRMAIIAKKILD